MMKKHFKKKYRLLRFYIKLFIITLFIPIIYNYIPMKMGKQTIYLPSSDIDSVIDVLSSYGYGVSFIDKAMLRFLDTPKKGWYTVTKQSKQRFMFFRYLNKQVAKTMSIKIFSGENSIELTKRLANDMKLSDSLLLDNYKKLLTIKEGDILAGRYTIARDADEEVAMASIFYESKDRLKQFAIKNIGREFSDTELNVLLTIASIIEKETNSKTEMSIISSVIQNRLYRDMKLQMDATLNYGIYSKTPITSKRIKEDKTRYNTYKYKGLPPAPLCSVSIYALNASLYPPTSKFIYFMLDRKGHHNFSTTYKMHKKYIQEYKLNKK